MPNVLDYLAGRVIYPNGSTDNMRKPKALSPTALRQWRINRDEFYLSRLAERRAPKFPQSRPMAIGSAFDAYVKSVLHRELFGATDPRFEFDTIFAAQVESQNRDWALTNGRHAFESYRTAGALLRLRDNLMAADRVRFEFATERVVNGVPLSGFPDLHYVLEFPTVLDWKVKGYCSSASPSPGYVVCWDGWHPPPHSRSEGKPHPKTTFMFHGQRHISAGYLEDSNTDHAAQLAIYAWLEGEPVGDENVIVEIEELACGKGDPLPRIRVASHCARISKGFQERLLGDAKAAWAAIESGHIFTDLSRADSDARCETLEQTAALLAIADDADEPFNVRKQ